jgi:hypothetical protein
MSRKDESVETESLFPFMWSKGGNKLGVTTNGCVFSVWNSVVIMAYSHYECTETIASFAFKRVNSMGCE